MAIRYTNANPTMKIARLHNASNATSINIHKRCARRLASVESALNQAIKKRIAKSRRTKQSRGVITALKGAIII